MSTLPNTTTPDPHATERARVAAILATPPPDDLTFEQRACDLAMVGRMFPALKSQALELVGVLARQELSRAA